MKSLLNASVAATRRSAPRSLRHVRNWPSTASSPATAPPPPQPGIPLACRSFVSSAPRLSSRPADASSTTTDDASSSPGSGGSSSSKSPPHNLSKRKQSTKNSLRRVAMVAQKTPARSPSSPHTDEPPTTTSAIPPASTHLPYPSPSSYPSLLPTPTSATSATSATTTTPQPQVASAICLAESFHMPTVLSVLASHGFVVDPDSTAFEPSEVVHARTLNGGDIFVFPSGSLVAWSQDPDTIAPSLLRAAQDAYPSEDRESEDLDYVLDQRRETSHLESDVIVLGTRRETHDGDRRATTLAKIAFSSGLARSAKLAVLESAMTRFVESIRHIPGMLSRGQTGVPRRFIVQKTGELLDLRARLNYYNELTDSLPELFWESRSDTGLEEYYGQVGKALDATLRISALNKKMDYSQEIAAILRQMSSEQHSTRLEVIIIILIAVEVVLELKMPQALLGWYKRKVEGTWLDAEAAKAEV